MTRTHERRSQGLPTVGWLLMLSLLCVQPAMAAVSIEPHVLGSGGGTSSSATLELRATLGQPIAGSAASASHSVGGGFWPALPPPPVGEAGSTVRPLRLALGLARPNPTGLSAVIPYALPQETDLRLEIYNVQGRVVRQLWKGTHPAGTHTIEWNGRSDAGRLVSPGVYFYSLSTRDRHLKRKLIVIR